MSSHQLLGTEVEGRTVVQRGASDTSVPMVGAKKVKGYRGSADRLSRAVVMTIKKYLAISYQENHERFGKVSVDDYPFKQNYNTLPDKAAMQYFVTALNAVTKKLKAWDFVARANEVEAKHVGFRRNDSALARPGSARAPEAFIYSNTSGGTVFRTVYIHSTNRGAFKMGPSTKKAGPISIERSWSWGSQYEHLSPEMVECLPSDWTDWVNAAFDRSQAYYGDRERVKKIGQYEGEIKSLVESYMPRTQKQLDQWNDPEWVAEYVANQVQGLTVQLNDYADRLKRATDNLNDLKGGEEE